MPGIGLEKELENTSYVAWEQGYNSNEADLYFPCLGYVAVQVLCRGDNSSSVYINYDCNGFYFALRSEFSTLKKLL